MHITHLDHFFEQETMENKDSAVNIEAFSLTEEDSVLEGVEEV